MYFTITWVKKIVRYFKDFVIQRFVIDRRSTVTDKDVEVLLKVFQQWLDRIQNINKSSCLNILRAKEDSWHMA